MERVLGRKSLETASALMSLEITQYRRIWNGRTSEIASGVFILLRFIVVEVFVAIIVTAVTIFGVEVGVLLFLGWLRLGCVISRCLRSLIRLVSYTLARRKSTVSILEASA